MAVVRFYDRLIRGGGGDYFVMVLAPFMAEEAARNDVSVDSGDVLRTPRLRPGYDAAGGNDEGGSPRRKTCA